MQELLAVIYSNKEWIFSGVGVALVSALFVWFRRRGTPRANQVQSSGNNSVNVQAGRDLNISDSMGISNDGQTRSEKR